MVCLSARHIFVIFQFSLHNSAKTAITARIIYGKMSRCRSGLLRRLNFPPTLSVCEEAGANLSVTFPAAAVGSVFCTPATRCPRSTCHLTLAISSILLFYLASNHCTRHFYPFGNPVFPLLSSSAWLSSTHPSLCPSFRHLQRILQHPDM